MTLLLALSVFALSTSVAQPTNWVALRQAVENANETEITELILSASFDFADYDHAITVKTHVVIHAEEQVWAIAESHPCNASSELTCSFFLVTDSENGALPGQLELSGALTVKGSRNARKSAIAVTQGATLKLNGTTMANCHTHKHGAAILVDGENSIVNASNASFFGNTASKNGGAVALIDGAKGMFANSHFDLNSCGIEGGAIYASSSFLKLTDTLLERNYATMGSGAVHLESGWAHFIRSHFSTNSAGSKSHVDTGAAGGAMTLSIGAHALIDNTAFTSNTAEQGSGAIRVCSGTNVTVIRPRFLSNTDCAKENSVTVEQFGNIVMIGGGASPPSLRGTPFAIDDDADDDTAAADDDADPATSPACSYHPSKGALNIRNCISASSCCHELKLQEATTTAAGGNVTLSQFAIIASGVATLLCVTFLVLFVHYYRKNQEARHCSDLNASDLDVDLTEPILDQNVVVTIEDPHDGPHRTGRDSMDNKLSVSSPSSSSPKLAASKAAVLTTDIMATMGMGMGLPGMGMGSNKNKPAPNELPGQIAYKSIKWTKQKGGALVVLGEGAYGVVYEGSFEGRPAAIKRIKIPSRRQAGRHQQHSNGSPNDGSSSGHLHDIHRRLTAVRTEIELLWKLRHPHILQTYGVAFVRERQEESVCLVSEQCRGSLDLYIQRSNQSTQGRGGGVHSSAESRSCGGVSNCDIDMSMPILTPNMLVRLMEETASALAFMHERRVIHRDLKPHNIFIAQDGSARIGDFGLSRLLNHHKRQSLGRHSIAAATLTMQQSLTANIGSPAYMAPELLSMPGDGAMPRLTVDLDDDPAAENDRGSGSGVETARYGAAVDIYAFGIILNCLWRRCSPYDERRFHGAIHLLRCVEDGHRPQDPVAKLGCPAFYVDLTHKCWAPKPSDRITAMGAYMLLQARGEPSGQKQGAARLSMFTSRLSCPLGSPQKERQQQQQQQQQQEKEEEERLRKIRALRQEAAAKEEEEKERLRKIRAMRRLASWQEQRKATLASRLMPEARAEEEIAAIGEGGGGEEQQHQRVERLSMDSQLDLI
jgi:serine/threonine protein kinase